MNAALKDVLTRFQKNEITEHVIYGKLAAVVRKEQNREAFDRLAAEELAHYEYLRGLTSEEIKPSRFKVLFFYLITRLFGLNFGVRLMERGEESAQHAYRRLEHVDPQIDQIIKEEEQHEEQLLELIDQEALQYTGSIVLGLNDALVELIGALAGLTLALQNTRIVAIAGLITGIAASFSMAASEYLSTKEEGGKDPLRASIYTGIAYICSVAILILPYFILHQALVCFGVALACAILIILFFTFYIAVAKDLPFRKRFFEMAGISLGVAILNFGIGMLVRTYLHVDV